MERLPLQIPNSSPSGATFNSFLGFDPFSSTALEEISKESTSQHLLNNRSGEHRQQQIALSEYELKLRRINAFGLSEVTDRVTMKLLAKLEYHTGKNGISVQRRRRILDRIYFNTLPKDTSTELSSLWSSRSPKERLRVLAETLTYVCMGRELSLESDSLLSAKEIKQDLAYLKKMYYYPSYDYLWPSSSRKADAFISNTVIVKSSAASRVGSMHMLMFILFKKVFLFN